MSDMGKGSVDNRISYLKDSRGANLEDKYVFAELAKRGRKLTKMTLRDVADRFYTAPGTFSRWENGHCAPPLVSRQRIINSFCSLLRTRSGPFIP